MKYLKSVLWIIIPLLILSLLFSLLYYVNIFNDRIFEYIKIFTPIISLFLGGMYLGKNSKQNGWLEGLKLGGVIILILFMISYLGLGYGFSLKRILYYLILLLTTVFGSMFGIRNVEKEQ